MRGDDVAIDFLHCGVCRPDLHTMCNDWCEMATLSADR